MKKIVAVGEYILLKEHEEDLTPGVGLVLSADAKGDKRYKVIGLGNAVDSEIEENDLVFAKIIDLIPVSPDGDKKVYFIHYSKVLGAEIEE